METITLKDGNFRTIRTDIFGMGSRERNKRRLSEKNQNRIEGNVAKRFVRVYGFKKRVRI